MITEQTENYKPGAKRKYFHNKDYFKKIDTEEKAYWLGFLYADGCITDVGLNLSIDQIDIELLKRFKQCLKFTGIIEKRNDAINYGEKYGIKISKICKIRITCKKLKQDLEILGCFQRKTFILKFPTEKQVPKYLIRHFIRGYFDGDGSVYERKYKRKDGRIRGYVNITGTLDMVKSIKIIFIKLFELKENSIYISPHQTSKGIFRLMFCTFNGMKLLRSYLYNNANIFLKRKKERFFSLYLEPTNNKNINSAKQIVLSFLKKRKSICEKDIFSKTDFRQGIINKAIRILIKEKRVVFLKKVSYSKYYTLA